VSRENITIRIGRRLRHLREQAGLSQIEMSHQFGIDRGNISEWENAKVCPSLPMLETLADGFKITISKLLQGI
jgi:transcriptional regulator with XRE-family HTH domain